MFKFKKIVNAEKLPVDTAKDLHCYTGRVQVISIKSP